MFFFSCIILRTDEKTRSNVPVLFSFVETIRSEYQSIGTLLQKNSDWHAHIDLEIYIKRYYQVNRQCIFFRKRHIFWCEHSIQIIEKLFPNSSPFPFQSESLLYITTNIRRILGLVSIVEMLKWMYYFFGFHKDISSIFHKRLMGIRYGAC